MSNIPEHISEFLVDKLNANHTGVINGNKKMTCELCTVVDHDIKTNLVKVFVDRAGFTNIPITVAGLVHYQTDMSGTGEVSYLPPDTKVWVIFPTGMAGTKNQGFILGTQYLYHFRKAPGYAPIHQSNTGRGRVDSGPKGELGNAEFVDDESNESKTFVGRSKNYEMLNGSEHVLSMGLNTTREQELLEKTGKALSDGAKLINNAVKSVK